MSSAPPSDEDERGSTETPPNALDDGPWREEAAIYREELGHSAEDGRRTGRLLHELARLLETRGGDEREARKLYAQSLTADPTLVANTWALFRLFWGRRNWENLVRLLDAEVRFAALPSDADRADMLVEKGRLLEDQLGRRDEARAAFRSALGIAPGHPAAVLGLLFSALDSPSGAEATGDVKVALEALYALVEDPELRGLLAVELSRAQRGPFSSQGGLEAASGAAETLFSALASDGQGRPICAELDRLSLASGNEELRLRVLDTLDARLARDGTVGAFDAPFVVALFREKARAMEKRGDSAAALAVVERALGLVPGHPLLVADMLELGEANQDPDALARLLEGSLSARSPRRDEALLRRAACAARAGALGEAIGSLDLVPTGSPWQPLVDLARVRILTQLRDPEGLRQAYRLLVERRLAGEPADPHHRAEAAHLLVRAAVVGLEFLEDPAGAQADLGQALALVPGYPPALETLRRVRAARGDWGGLAGDLEEELGSANPDQRAVLHQTLLVLYRDLLRDPSQAARHEQAVQASLEEVMGATRAADLAGDRTVATGEGAEEAVLSLRTLSELSPDPEVAAGLRLLAARLAAHHGADRSALALAEEAWKCAPIPAVGVELERLYRESGHGADLLRVLSAELAACDEAAFPLEGRGLRFRLALAAAAMGDPEAALASLRPLVEGGDVSAVLWSLELARTGGRPALAEPLLGAPASGAALAGPTGRGGEGEGEGERLRLWAENKEALGDGAGAAAVHRALLESAAAQSEPAFGVEAALGLLRTDTDLAEGAAVAEAFERLARVTEPDPVASGLRREAELFLATAEGAAARATSRAESASAFAPAAGASSGVFEALAGWLWAVHGDSPQAPLGPLAAMGAAAAPGPGRAVFLAAVGIRQLAAQVPEGWTTLATAYTESPAATEGGALAVAVTDLAGRDPLPAALSPLRRARAEKLLGDAIGAPLGETLLFEEAEQEEAAGRLRSAGMIYADVLGGNPDSLEALEGLRRLAALAGDRRAAANTLLQIGARLSEPGAAAERYAEAALLFEEEGLLAEAGNAFLEVLGRVPADEEAYRRLCRIVAEREPPEALERLIGFKLGCTSRLSSRAALYAERAALRLGPLGRRQEGIFDHRRALQIEPDRVESLRALGELALEEHRHPVAVGYLERAVAHAPEANLAALRLLLAKAYEGDERIADAERTIREAIDAAPEDRRAREWFVELATRQGHFDRVAEQLVALGALTPDPAEKAALLVRLGRIEREERQAPQRAMAAFRSALELDPLGGAVAELVVTSAGRPLSPEDAAAANVVIADLRAALGADPLQVRPLECLRDLAQLRGLVDLRDAAAQLLNLLGVTSARGRAKDLLRTVPLRLLGALGAEGEAPGLALLHEIWPHLCQGAAKLTPVSLAELGGTRHNRIQAGSDPRLAWAESASVAVGIPSLTLYVGGLDDLGVEAVDTPEAALVLGQGVVGGDPVSRFRVGRALVFIKQRACAIARLSSGDLDLLWASAVFLAANKADPRFDPAVLKATAKKLGKGLSRREIKSLQSYGPVLAETRIDPGSWRAAIRETANRFALLVCGDLGMALRAMTGENAPGPETLRRPDCLSLIHFALGDRYGSVRQEVGLTKD